MVNFDHLEPTLAIGSDGIVAVVTERNAIGFATQALLLLEAFALLVVPRVVLQLGCVAAHIAVRAFWTLLVVMLALEDAKCSPVAQHHESVLSVLLGHQRSPPPVESVFVAPTSALGMGMQLLVDGARRGQLAQHDVAVRLCLVDLGLGRHVQRQ